MAVVFSSNGNDNINGTPQADVIFARAGNDTVNSRTGNDIVFGENGNDTLNGGGDNDSIFGDDGNDRLIGEGGNDRLLAGSGNDFITAGTGDDTLIGGFGNDKLAGGVGSDILIGSVGNDTLTGNAGRDHFAIFGRNEGTDLITDFAPADDTILVSTKFGGGLRTGTITAAQLQFGTAAKDGNDRFIYDTNTGALYFDADGTGSAKQIQIATLGGAPRISNADILIFNENQLGISQSSSISVDSNSSRSSSSQISNISQINIDSF